MKSTITALLLFLLYSTQVGAQNCSSFQDCYNQAGTNKGETAIELYKKALKFAKKNPVQASQANLELGKVYYKQIRNKDSKKEIKNTSKYFEAALAEDPLNFYAWEWMIAFYQVKIKDFNQAIDYANQAVAKFPTYARAFSNRGNVYHYYNKKEQASNDYQQAVDLVLNGQDTSGMKDSSLAEILVSDARQLMREDDRKFFEKEDIATLEKYIDKFPQNAQLWGYLALAYFDDGNIEEAKVTGNRAWVLDGEKKFDACSFLL